MKHKVFNRSPFQLAIISGILIGCAFPPIPGVTAWFGFLPLIHIWQTQSPKESARWSFFAAVIADPVLCAVQSNRKIGALADKFFEGKCISSFANYVSLLGVPILCIAILYPPGMFLKKTFHYGVALLSFIALDILFRKLANLLAGVLEKVGSKG